MSPGRILTPFVMLALMAACAPLTSGGHVAKEAPGPGPDPELAKVEDLSDTLPDESGMRPAKPPLSGPKSTVAGLGDPSKPGLWLETPLVSAQGPGRIRLASGGGTVAVTLLPVAGETTAGSRLSLEAMRQLGAPLTELVELTVTPGG